MFEVRVAIEAIAGHKTVNEIRSAYEIHPSRVAKWKSGAPAYLPEVSANGRQVKTPSDSQTEARLYEEVGRLTMEVEYLKESSGSAARAPSRADRIGEGVS
ncbi:MAG: hypothetical protein ABFE13_14470 [Phycisphaerales bacterium]